MGFNNRMRTYEVIITDEAHSIIAPDGACIARLPAAWIAQQVADGFMTDAADLLGLAMTLNMRGVIRQGSRLVESDSTAHA